MKCIVLAAGYATRMYPLCENFPKPLLEVGRLDMCRKTILDWLVDDVASCGVSSFVIVSNHRFLSHFSDWADRKRASSGLDIVVLDDGSTDNENRLGAVKDIEFAIESLGLDDDLLVLAGDNVLDFSFKGFLEYAKEKNTTCVMRHFQGNVEKLRKTGVAVVDENGLILDMEEKPQNPKSNWAVPPFYFYKRSDLGLFELGIKSGCKTDAPGSFIEWMSRQTAVHAYEMPGQRFDVGSIEGYEKIREEYTGIR